MMKKLSYLSFFVSLVLIVFSCKDSDTAPKYGRVFLKISAIDSVSAITPISYAHLTIRSIEFTPASAEVVDSDIDFFGDSIFDINLLTGTSLPEAAMSFGKYDTAVIVVDIATDTAKSVNVTGKYVPTEGTPLVFVLSAKDIKLKAQLATDAIEVVNGVDSVKLSMTVDLRKWFEGVIFSSGNITSDTVYVGNTINTSLYNQIKANIEKEVLIIKQN